MQSNRKRPLSELTNQPVSKRTAFLSPGINGTPSSYAASHQASNSFSPQVHHHFTNGAISSGYSSLGSSSDDEHQQADDQPSSRMRVYVRVRPENEKESRNSAIKTVVEVTSERMLVFDPKDGDDGYFYKGKMFKEIGRKANKNLSFCFDQVFDETSTNYDVYRQATRKLVDSFLDGYNCTVFAYGATGSGKTHTMIGIPESDIPDDWGVIYHTAAEIFNRINSEKTDELGNERTAGVETLEISVSYIEIYNEQVYDLLSPSLGKSLSVREDPRRGVMVANLSVHMVEDARQLLRMIDFGNRNRAMQATDANKQSSRSHAIFQLYLTKRDYSTSQQTCTQLSKMSLIDLAGSERASVAYKGKRNKCLQREGSNINKSLLALGNCINALVVQSRKRGGGNVHIPYRDSKLTLLLRDSLGGNCQTAMIAAISPTDACFEDTHNTLTYANRAKGITFTSKKNVITSDIEPKQYQQALEAASRRNQALEHELQEVRAELEKTKQQLNQIPQNPIQFNQSSLDILNSVKNRLDTQFDERISLRRKYLEFQSELKKIDLKMLFRRMDLRRLRAFEQRQTAGGHTPLNTTFGYGYGAENSNRSLVSDDDFSQFHAKREHCSNQLEHLEKKIRQNEIDLLEMEKTLQQQVPENDFVVTNYFERQKIQCEFMDKSVADKHVNIIFADLLTRFEANEKLLVDSMELHRHVQEILSGMNRFSDSLRERFDKLRRKFEGKKNLAWRDAQPEKRRMSVYEQHNLRNVFLLDVYRIDSKTPAKTPESTQLLTSVYNFTPSEY